MKCVTGIFFPGLRAALLTVFVLSTFAQSAFHAPTVQAISLNLVIAQVYGGGGNSGAPYNHDFVVLFNRGSAPASLAGLSLQYASATGTGLFSANRFPLPSATLAPGQYYLVQFAGGANGASLPQPDASGSTTLSATAGKLALVNSTTGLACNGGTTPCDTGQTALIVDLVGYGSADYYEGAAGPAPAPSNTTAVIRINDGSRDTDFNADDFQALPPEPRNTGSAFYAAPYVLSTMPAAHARNTSLNAVLSITFNKPVSTAGNWFSISCFLSGSHTAAVSGGPNTFILDPDVDFVIGETCTVTVAAAYVTDLDSDDPPDAMVGDYHWKFTAPGLPARIHEIQGSGHISPLNNWIVAVAEGIVTARTKLGFYIQDPQPDGNLATSEAIFVYTDRLPAVNVGDAVSVEGQVQEYRAGSDGANLTVTELISPFVTVISSGNTLPAPIVIGSGGRVPPNMVIEDDAPGDVEMGGMFDPDSDGLDFYESLEAMRVQINNAVVVGPKNSYGEAQVIGDNGAFAGLRTRRGGIVIRPSDFNPERITLDDEVLKVLSQAMPLMNVGDSIPGPLVGVMDYGYGLFRIQVSGTPSIASAGLAREVAQQPTALQLAVASFNAENLSAKDPQDRFDTLAGLIINNLRAPDVLALEEIQDNNGATNDGVVDASQTLDRLVAAIQNLNGPVYEYRQINPMDDQDGGQPGGNIRVAFLFREDRGLAFVDRPGADAATTNAVVSDGSGVHLLYSPGRIDPTNTAFAASRKPLAGEFLYRGKRILIIANHFNSKGGDQPLFGRYQPPVLSSEVQRVQQAQVVHDFVQSILNQDAQARVVVLGDLNDYQFSSPLNTLKGSPAILTTLIETLPEAERYTYVYQGNAQALDHILVSSALAARPLIYDSVHVNAEFVEQASDHDPQLLLISLPYQEIHLPLISH